MGDTVSSAEIAVVAAALGADASPWIEDSDLLQLDRPILERRLIGGRDGLLLRELAAERDDGSLDIREPLAGAFMDAQRATVGFELQRARSGSPPVRTQFGLAGDSPVAHDWLPGDLHAFSRLGGVADIAAAAVASATLRAAEGPPRAYSVPHEVMASLAKSPPEPENSLREILGKAGVSAADAGALLRAGLAPAEQGVFWSIGLRGNQVRARALLWFSDAETNWLITNFDESGNVTLQTAGPAELEAAVAALIAATLESA